MATGEKKKESFGGMKAHVYAGKSTIYAIKYLYKQQDTR